MSKKLIEATAAIAQPIAERMGLELIDVEYKKEAVGMVLTVYVDKPGGVSMDDCQALSSELDPLLDEMEDGMPQGYFFSVSSPGLDRPLKKDADYRRNLFKIIQVKLFAPLEGKRNFKGTLEAFDSQTVTLSVDGKQVVLPRQTIASAKPYIEF